jgi:peptidoglycan/LPS O-acetylase OafA/YrhL
VPRIRFLDSLRGLAALIVLVHHACTMFPRTLMPSAHNTGALFTVLAQVGRFNTEAVLLFFVLSGFSIRLSIEPHGLSGRAALVDYVQRRLVRILPLYWFALFLSYAVAALFAPLPSLAVAWSTLLGNLLFLQTAVGVEGLWFLPYAGNGALWSLSFEMFYYATFPLLFRAIADRRARLVAVAGATLLGQLSSMAWPSPFTLFLGASAIWYVGVELAEIFLSRRAVLGWPLASGLFLLLSFARAGSYAQKLHGLWIASMCLLAGHTLIVHAPRLSAPARLLDRPLLAPLARVGDYSYALYLLHVPVLRAFHAAVGDSFFAVGLALPTSLVLALVMERAVVSVRARRDSRGFAAPRGCLAHPAGGQRPPR